MIDKSRLKFGRFIVELVIVVRSCGSDTVNHPMKLLSRGTGTGNYTKLLDFAGIKNGTPKIPTSLLVYYKIRN